MAELVKEGFGIAALPRAAAERLAGFLPLRVLSCDTALTPLPIHASLREDPTSPHAHAVLDSALSYVGVKAPAHRKNR